jgi:hypothetical protein
MSNTDDNQKIMSIRSAVDFDIVGDNIQDIAEFTIEKYEFRNDSDLPDEIRKEAIAKINSALWQEVEELKLRRREILVSIFNAAEDTLNEVLDEK